MAKHFVSSAVLDLRLFSGTIADIVPQNLQSYMLIHVYMEDSYLEIQRFFYFFYMYTVES